MQLPPTDYSHLNRALESAAMAAQLVPTPVFIEKAQQLYEMILVRHGLMIVGYPYGAQTSRDKLSLIHLCRRRRKKRSRSPR